ncbi:hypothetical protein IV203_027088 [Nitzschia inconspicua]|uniref:Uncharacterized protein n=1 Tax=Nitzschia inconspicua TaxID=303405 RepID=A0A9K3LKG7_9STRA|nr:hypothetical protein IV203_027088 [Nitzschia inconspicua]
MWRRQRRQKSPTVKEVKKIKEIKEIEYPELVIKSPETFKAATFMEEDTELSSSSTRTVPLGGICHISFKLLVHEGGVVALDNAKDVIKEVVCSTVAGEVTIRLKFDFPKNGDPKTVFPLGAILAINHEVFGDCETPPITPAESDMMGLPEGSNLSFNDFFFLIDEIGGTM